MQRVCLWGEGAKGGHGGLGLQTLPLGVWSSGICRDRCTCPMLFVCLCPSQLCSATCGAGLHLLHHQPPSTWGRQWEAAAEGDGGAERALGLFILQGPFLLRGSQLAVFI